MEERAAALAEQPLDEIRRQVEDAIKNAVKSGGAVRSEQCTLLAWLVRLGILDPAALLRVLVVTRDRSVLHITGTTCFTTEDRKKLNMKEDLKPADGRAPVQREGLPLKIDVGRLLLKRQKPEPEPTKPELDQATQTPPPLSVATPAPTADAEYTAQIRRLVLSSMSPTECVYKLRKAFRANSEETVAETLLEIVLEQKLYNPVLGRTATLLSKPQSSQHKKQAQQWASAYARTLHRYITSERFRNATLEALHVSASFFSDLLSSKTMEYSALRPMVLDLEVDHASERIFTESLLLNLRTEIGTQNLVSILKQNSTALTGILESPLSPEFLVLVGLDGLLADMDPGHGQ